MTYRPTFRGPAPYKYETFLVALLAVAAFFIYARTLPGPFVFDSIKNIENNPHIRLTHLSLKGLIDAGIKSPSKNRPIANISFALNYYFGRYNPVGYHLVNILIHITCGILLYLLIKTTLSTPALQPRWGPDAWIPFFAALLWLVHPLQTQAVSYIVQRMTSLATLFYLLCLLLYVKSRLAASRRARRWLLAGCVAAAVLGFGSKEITATLPFFIFLYEWYFLQDLDTGWLKRRWPLLAGIVLVVAVLSLLYAGRHPFERIAGFYTHRPVTMIQRVLTEFRVVMLYISLLLWPHPSRLNLDHDFLLSTSLVHPLTTLLSLGAISALIVMAVLLAKKQRLVSFCILWYFGNLVLESSIIGLEPIFEHRNYLPSTFVALLAVALAFRYIRPKWLGIGLLCAVAVGEATWTAERNAVWRDDIALWTDCIKKSPHKARPYNNLGVILADRGYYKEAAKAYLKALAILPNYTNAHANLGYALARQGKLKAAIVQLQTALKLDPTYYEAHSNLGIVLTIQGDLEGAIKHFKAALKINPDYADAHNNLGVALRNQGHLPAAIEHFTAALKLNPDSAATHNNLGVALEAQGRYSEAARHFSAALRIQPNYAAARRNLQECLEKIKARGGQPGGGSEMP